MQLLSAYVLIFLSVTIMNTMGSLNIPFNISQRFTFNQCIIKPEML